ncbi:Negative elongation factor B [Zancudomyces culisetae]|uniref:Negative elongation factor B n=1 Tax=Zancudomyces culisetae TaxID=1213189 RepID=A0A1R1PS23_ZANCU|nr:Negative elongation factor B [Zancudomyces culisetae]|eukprot:OMH83751.1 Negative elongation factor B [Zancudomyces culisetae]
MSNIRENRFYKRVSEKMMEMIAEKIEKRARTTTTTNEDGFTRPGGVNTAIDAQKQDFVEKIMENVGEKGKIHNESIRRLIFRVLNTVEDSRLSSKVCEEFFKNEGLYGEANSVLKQKLWNSDERVLKKYLDKSLEPFLNDRAVDTSMFDMNRIVVSGLYSKKNEHEAIEEIVEIIGEDIELYEKVVSYLQTTKNIGRRELGSGERGTIRLELLMALHARDNTVLLERDGMHTAIWTLDAAIRKNEMELDFKKMELLEQALTEAERRRKRSRESGKHDIHVMEEGWLELICEMPVVLHLFAINIYADIRKAEIEQQIANNERIEVLCKLMSLVQNKAEKDDGQYTGGYVGSQVFYTELMKMVDVGDSWGQNTNGDDEEGGVTAFIESHQQGVWGNLGNQMVFYQFLLDQFLKTGVIGPITSSLDVFKTKVLKRTGENQPQSASSSATTKAREEKEFFAFCYSVLSMIFNAIKTRVLEYNKYGKNEEQEQEKGVGSATQSLNLSKVIDISRRENGSVEITFLAAMQK